MSENWKFAYTTRRVRHDAIAAVVGGDHVPEPGDLVLAEVLEIGQHERIELIDGRRAIMFPGDKIVVAYGNRYAPDQFEAVVPADLGVCDLVAGGGAGKVTGTGAGPDMWLMQDAGAEITLDFTDAGYVSTSLLDLPALQGIVDTLLGTMGAAGVDVVVFEVADGLLQPETAALVGS